MQNINVKEVSKTGSIIAFNKSFEITQIKNLASVCLDICDEILALNNSFTDLTLAMVRIWKKSYELKSKND